MGAMAYQITSVSIVYTTVCSGADQRKHRTSASPAFVRGIHRWPVNSPHKGPVTRKMFSLDDVIMGVEKECSHLRDRWFLKRCQQIFQESPMLFSKLKGTNKNRPYAIWSHCLWLTTYIVYGPKQTCDRFINSFAVRNPNVVKIRLSWIRMSAVGISNVPSWNSVDSIPIMIPDTRGYRSLQWGIFAVRDMYIHL